MQSRHSKLYCLCNRDIQNFIVCAVETFETLLFVQSRHSKLYCLCSGDIQNFIVCAIATFKTLLFVQSSHSKLFSLRVPSGAPYKTKSTGVKIVYCQRLSCFGRHLGVLERDTNMAAPYVSLQNNLIFIDIYVVKGIRALKCCSIVYFFPLSKPRNIILLWVTTR